MVETITLESLLNPTFESEIISLEPEEQEFIALNSIAEESNLPIEFGLEMESTHLTFEGFGKYFKPIKFGIEVNHSADDMIRRLKENGAEQVIKTATDVMAKKGFAPIKSESELKSLLTEYNKEHPIKDWFNRNSEHVKDYGIGDVAPWRIIAGLFGFVNASTAKDSKVTTLGGVCLIINTTNGSVQGGVSARRNVHDDMSGAAGACYACYYNSEKNKFKFVTVARPKFISVPIVTSRQDKAAKIKAGK